MIPAAIPTAREDRGRGLAVSLLARGSAIALGRRHRGHVLTVVLQLLSLGLSMVTFRLAATWFGAAGFGEYALARRALSVVTFPLLLGLGTSLPRFASRHRAGSGSAGPASYALATLLIAGPVLLVSAALIGAMPGRFAGLFFGDPGLASLSRPTLAAIVGLYLHVLVYSLLIGRFRTGAASLLQVINVAAAPALAVFASGGDVRRALLWLGAISAGTSIAAALAASRGLGLRAASRGPLAGPIRELLAFGIPRVPGEVALFGLFALPVFVAARRAGVEQAGLLSFGMSLIQLVGSVFAAGAVLLLPQTGRMLAEGRSGRVALVVAWSLGLAIAAAAAMVAAMEATLGSFIGMILGPGLAGGAASARWLLLGAVPYVAFIVLRGPLDAVSTRPHGAVNLAIALAVEALWLAAGGTPDLGLPMALAVLGALMVVSWNRALRALRDEHPGPIGDDRPQRCDDPAGGDILFGPA